MKSSNLCQIGAAEQSYWSLLMFSIDFIISRHRRKPSSGWVRVKCSEKLQKIMAFQCVALSVPLSAGMSAYWNDLFLFKIQPGQLAKPEGNSERLPAAVWPKAQPPPAPSPHEPWPGLSGGHLDWIPSQTGHRHFQRDPRGGGAQQHGQPEDDGRRRQRQRAQPHRLPDGQPHLQHHQHRAECPGRQDPGLLRGDPQDAVSGFFFFWAAFRTIVIFAMGGGFPTGLLSSTSVAKPASGYKS